MPFVNIPECFLKKFTIVRYRSPQKMSLKELICGVTKREGISEEYNLLADKAAHGVRQIIKRKYFSQFKILRIRFVVSLSNFKVLKHMVFIFNCESGLQKLCANWVIAL